MADGHVAEEKTLAVVRKEPLAFTPRNLDEMWRISEMVSKSSLAPPALRGNPYDCQLVLMTGYELGLTPTQSLRDIDVVKGKTYMRALLKVALVKQSPVCKFFRLVESTEKRAIFETERVGEGLTRFEFTFEDAQRARVVGRDGEARIGRDGKPMDDDNWTKWLRLMLRRRCASQLADEVYPDVVRGIADKEDLEEKEVEATATVTRVGVAPPPPDPTPPRKVKNKFNIVDLTAETTPSEAVKAAGAITNSDMDRAGPPPVEQELTDPASGMTEFEQICANLDICETVDQVDDLSMAHVNYKGPRRSELGKLFKDKRASVEKKK